MTHYRHCQGLRRSDGKPCLSPGHPYCGWHKPDAKAPRLAAGEREAPTPDTSRGSAPAAESSNAEVTEAELQLAADVIKEWRASGNIWRAAQVIRRTVRGCCGHTPLWHDGHGCLCCDCLEPRRR